jgi:hypothetical protein
VFKKQVLWQPVENAFGYSDKLRESPMLPVIVAGHTQDTPAVAKIDLSGAAIFALSAIDGGVERDSISSGPLLHACASAHDNAGGLVSHDNRRLAPAGAAIEAVDVTATDTASFYRNQDFPCPWFRGRHILIDQVLVCFQY